MTRVAQRAGRGRQARPARRSAGFRVVRRRAAADEAFPLDRRVAGHEPDLVAHLGEAALDQPDRLDDDGRRLGCLRVGDLRQDPRPDRRMGDGLEVAQRGRVGEDDPPERRAIEGPVVAQDARPEPRDDRVEGRLAGLDDLARDPVGIDDDDPGPFPEPARDRRLAAPDRPGHPDPDRARMTGRRDVHPSPECRATDRSTGGHAGWPPSG